MSAHSNTAALGVGRALDPVVRRLLESSLGVDLSAVRVHTDVKAQQTLAAKGLEGAAIGRHVLLSENLTMGTERWLHVLAHEVAHTVQQAQGVRAQHPVWELEAELAAQRVLDGGSAEELCLTPPKPGLTGVFQGFNSW